MSAFFSSPLFLPLMVTLFTSDVACTQAQAFAAYISLTTGHEVELKPLEQLVVRSAAAREALKLESEVAELDQLINTASWVIAEGEKDPFRIALDLPTLRANRKHYEARRALLRLKLCGIKPEKGGVEL
jgi:hypothetical protein